METADGPWTVIQNRQDGQVDFYRKWADYKNGFGDKNGNFWLGILEAIHQLTQKPSVLRIELTSWLGDSAYAQYSTFSIADESKNYRLSKSGFSENTSDAMAYHNGSPFSTYDKENNANACASRSSGAWWYKNCFWSNGVHSKDENGGMIWCVFYSVPG
ncbi:angiopoietin-related protein 7-like [Ylistrum balloti]|uniref:angiopoietin-related protein 7-like n=1 Tax=Ylistrum balloti TaxID=509963 RepID=UPI002905D989|nr:angiopoietin-related protein 7-like [Ylistrum balloti]